MYSQENISILHELFFLSAGSCDRPEDAQSSGNNKIFWGKNSVKSECFNKDRVITQNTPNCVENCCGH